jgi:hypothetical protein
MRGWVCGLLLAGATAGGMVFVFAGAGTPSHCGPCVPGPVPTQPGPMAPVGEPVTEVVDLAAVLSAAPAAPREPFVSFDEPPLARRAADPHSPRPTPGPGVVQAAYVGPPAGVLEQAPMPRTRRGPGALPLFSPADPF